MNKGQKHSNLTAEEIKKYLSGEAMPAQMHEVEKKLLNDAFAGDVADGFEALKADKIDEKAAINDLKKRLDKRVLQGKNKKKVAKTIPLWQSVSIAASVLLFLSAGIYYFTYKINKQVVTQKESIIISSKSEEKAPLPKNDDALVMNEQAKDLSKMKAESSSKIIANKEILTEAPPPAQSETENSNIISKSEEKITEAAPIPAQIEQETRRAVMAKPSAAMADKAEIRQQFSGQILDAENTPLAGVSVIKKNTNKGIQSDINGNFRFDDLKIGDVLQINSIGYNSQELVVKGSDLGKIKLIEDNQALSEVVVVGYGSEAKKTQPNKQLNQEPIPKIGWSDYDNYLINSLKNTNKESTLQLKEPLRFRLTVEPNGELSNVQIENNLSKEQTEKVVEIIENGPKWFPARKKGKKVRKNILRELKIK